ncbi:MAG: trypsin-like cysteine/serine peptidase domain-containing protein [Monoraphidium minutum]|nr:MAG: trypsin-like cysteine/serine peptidase domain-containing protein [Monoraphidium minutum]
MATAAAAPGGAAGAAGAGAARLQVTVHTSDGRVFEGAVAALDRPSDLAVVRIELGGGGGGGALVAARLGTSAGLQVGEWVCALGSPLMLRRTVTAGIVSALERSSSELGISTPRQAFVQTDAPINAGSSGGPLVNLDGEVVGILSMKALAADGVSFCVPIDTAKEVVEELGRHGRVRRPRIGAAFAEVSPARMAQLKASCPDFPAGVRRGLVVTGVRRGGAAEAGGLREDDVIVGWAGGGDDAPVGGGDDVGGGGRDVGGGGGRGGADMISPFAAALKRALGGPPLALRVVRQAGGGGGGGGYVFETLEVQPEEADC